MSINRRLDRLEVVGHVLAEIRQSSAIDERMVWAYSYYCLDSGVAFCLPDASADGLCTEDVPPEAEPIVHPLIPHIFGQRISDVMRSPNPEWCESLFLVLANGYLLYDVIGVPIGLEAGVVIFAPGDIDTTEFHTIWRMENE